MATSRPRSEAAPDTPLWLSAAAMLLTIRELAARVAVEELQRRSTPAFAEYDRLLSERFREFMGLAALPDRIRQFVGWLRWPDRAGADERRALPAGFDALAEDCLRAGWHQVGGSAVFAHDDQLLSRALHSEGIAPPLARLRTESWQPDSQSPWRWPLKPLSAAALRPVSRPEAYGSYAEVWRGLMQGGRRLPTEWPEDRDGLSRWLDRLDALLASALHAVPTRADRRGVPDSLYREARLAAAAAAATWHMRRAGAREDTAPAYLLVQAEFSPIQDFIFGTDPHTPWSSDAVLGARSSHVRLAMELASVAVLEALNLPPTSLLLSAASKALFLAPDTRAVRERVLPGLRHTLEEWSREAFYARAGIHLVWIPVGAEVVARGGITGQAGVSSTATFRRLHEVADDEKHQRWQLAVPGQPAVIEHYLPALDRWLGTCSLDAHAPASPAVQAPWALLDERLSGASAPPLSAQGATQLWHYLQLARPGRVRVLRDPDPRGPVASQDRLRMAGLALRIDAADAPVVPGLLRDWDLGDADGDAGRAFNGHARRGLAQRRRGQAVSDEGRRAVLCGDIDRLGHAFQRGIAGPSMSRTIELSRQLDQFFSLVLPHWLSKQLPGVDIALAGGDDFMFVGPWSQMKRLPGALWTLFTEHACNPGMGFSVGLAVAASDTPMKLLTDTAEAHLALAKRTRGAIGAHGLSVPWARWLELERLEQSCRQWVVDMPPEDAARLWRWLLELVRGLDRSDELLGLRWRPRLHAWLQRWARATARRTRPDQGRPGLAPGAVAEGLDRGLAAAVEAHGANLEIVLTHLLMEPS